MPIQEDGNIHHIIGDKPHSQQKEPYQKRASFNKLNIGTSVTQGTSFTCLQNKNHNKPRESIAPA